MRWQTFSFVILLEILLLFKVFFLASLRWIQFHWLRSNKFRIITVVAVAVPSFIVIPSDGFNIGTGLTTWIDMTIFHGLLTEGLVNSEQVRSQVWITLLVDLALRFNLCSFSIFGFAFPIWLHSSDLTFSSNLAFFSRFELSFKTSFGLLIWLFFKSSLPLDLAFVKLNRCRDWHD